VQEGTEIKQQRKECSLMKRLPNMMSDTFSLLNTNTQYSTTLEMFSKKSTLHRAR
jgi:hypothetical protein